MISFAKKLILNFYSFILRSYICGIKGVKAEKNCRILGLPKIIRKKGSRITLGPNVNILSKTRFNPLIREKMILVTFSPRAHIELGEGVGMSGSHIACCEHISIGDKTIIGPDCLIFDWQAHDYNPEKGWAGRKGIRGAAIKIGKHCYIGTRCTILKGVNIGNYCIIAAGTLVNQNVPDYHLASGNPMSITPLRNKEKYTSPADQER